MTELVSASSVKSDHAVAIPFQDVFSLPEPITCSLAKGTLPEVPD